MAYSGKKFWIAKAALVALLVVYGLVVFASKRNHVDPAIVTIFVMAVLLVAFSLGLRAEGYLDEIQRQSRRQAWLWASRVGTLAAALALVVLVIPNRPWLDETMQFIFRHPVAPRIYFGCGFMLVLLPQAAVFWTLRLTEKLPRQS